MTIVGEGIALKVGVELIKRVAPTGIAWVSTWLKGRRILIVGQPRSGKTSFANFLRFGVFADPRHKTPRTREIKKSAAFTVNLGREQALRLDVRNVIDTVGQVAAGEHAKNVREYTPHAVVVILDMSAPWAGQDEYSVQYYATEFFDYLAEVLRTNRKVRKNLKTLMIVLNKKDLATASKLSGCMRDLRKVLTEQLVHSFGASVRDAPILKMTLVESADEGQSATHVIKTLALSFQ